MRPLNIRTISILSAATAAVALPNAALAQNSDGEEEGGFYISLQAGVNSSSDESFEGTQAPVAPSPGVAGAPANVEVELNEDFVGTVAVGYRFPKRVLGLFQPSLELEYSYAESGVTGGNFNGGDQSFDGEFDINTFSLNYVSEVRWSDSQRIVPFFGGGVGIADVDADVTYFPNNGIATAPTFTLTGSDTGFSYQANVGVLFELTDQIDLQTSVRYQDVTGLDYDRTFVGGGNSAFNSRLEGGFETVSFLGGIRYRF